MDWRIYYSDSSSFGSEEGEPNQAPRRGVLVIVQRDTEAGRSLWKECDFYWWLSRQRAWVGGDLAGLLDYLAECAGAVVLQGRTVPDRLYRDVVRRAGSDPAFPPKRAWYSRERDGQTV